MNELATSALGPYLPMNEIEIVLSLGLIALGIIIVNTLEGEHGK